MEPSSEGPASAGHTGKATPSERLLAEPVQVVNLGLEGFARELTEAGIEVIQVQWAPPAGGDAHLADLLAKLQD